MFKRAGRLALAFVLALSMVFATGIRSDAANSYTVKKNDNLWKIAKEQYGDGTLYRLIVEANKDTVKNPNLIYPGQILTIPDKEGESNVPDITEPEDTTPQAVQEDEIYIVYTNDVHSYIYNTVKNDDGEESPGLRISKVAAMAADLRNEGKNVLVVDAGDEIQGDVYGAIDNGESIIGIMNAAGYQVATIGNHEFDYGTFELFKRVDEAAFPYITCNFRSLESDEQPFAASKTFDIGGKKVAFVGITTPETIKSSTPKYFQNEKGEYIYTIDGLSDPAELYASVQKAVDEVRADADYVIALGHVGINQDTRLRGWSSYDVIANVTGLDAFIDGHSHSTVECEKVADKSGKEVVLTQTGSYLKAVGLMKIDATGITASLVNEYENSDASVAALEDQLSARVQEELGEVIGTLETPLYILDPENPNTRFIRSQEMNAGDFFADAIYWFFNDKSQMDCDIALINGGALRAQTEKGEMTYLDVKSVQPFGNMVCMIEATGQNILDSLEKGASAVGGWDEEWNAPAENGGFMQVAGLKFTIDSSVASSVKTSAEGMFESVEGDYRVKDVMVYDKATGEYKPLELDKTYRLAGINYQLRNGGDGMSMFTDCSAVVDFVDLDYVIAAEYVKSFGGSVKTENSSLAQLNGYLIDYENPFGAGRITILK